MNVLYLQALESAIQKDGKKVNALYIADQW